MSGSPKAKPTVDGDIDGYQHKRPPWWQRLLFGYGGFLLGLPLVLVIMLNSNSFAARITESVAAYVPPSDETWTGEAAFVLVSRLAMSLAYFGPSLLLGGLLGTHRLRPGFVVATAYTLGWVLFVVLLLGPAAFERASLHAMAYAGSFIAGWLAYLLGFGLRRLVVLAFARRANPA